MNLASTRASTLLLPSLGFTLDIGRMGLSDAFVADKTTLFAGALAAMTALESGSIANPDEHRQVGHYWLRTPALAPTPAIRDAIETTSANILSFAATVHKAKKFTHFLLIGIGGSALGPQFIAEALDMGKANKMTPAFFDNTDPEGFERTLNKLDLKKTLVIVISKSGSTPETRNGMLAAQAAFARAKLKFAAQAVAITQDGSALDKVAVADKWLARFPMWDFVGGRTSVASAVGLLPMALQGINIGEFLQGASAMDESTRAADLKQNPAALLALSWLAASGGVGAKAMVVLPYKDRLVLFSKYLQQLIMESLGKANDLNGKKVCQGLTVYGNKGSTDQHAYVQQLRDGLNNFFATFIEVSEEGDAHSLEVEPGVTAGDYLQGLCLGTGLALEENYRQSMTLTLRSVNAFTVGALIALFERAVGFYATFINVNAYHQPGVEAGKKAAGAILILKKRLVETLQTAKAPMTLEALVEALAEPSRADVILRLLTRLSANPHYSIVASDPTNPFASTFSYGTTAKK